MNIESLSIGQVKSHISLHLAFLVNLSKNAANRFSSDYHKLCNGSATADDYHNFYNNLVSHISSIRQKQNKPC